MPDLTWSPEPPTAEGHYWFRSPASAATLCQITKRTEPDEAWPWAILFLEDEEKAVIYVPGVGDEFAGPLTPPADDPGPIDITGATLLLTAESGVIAQPAPAWAPE